MGGTDVKMYEGEVRDIAENAHTHGVEVKEPETPKHMDTPKPRKIVEVTSPNGTIALQVREYVFSSYFFLNFTN